MSKPTTLEGFLAEYNDDGSHPVTVIDVPKQSEGASPFIIVRHGDYVAVINPLGLGDHLSVDIHPFVEGQDATAAAFGMSKGRRWAFPKQDDGGPGTTSHKWPSTALVAVLVGEQAGEEKGLSL